MIECPGCEGRGKVTYNIGEDFDRVGECGMCEGVGEIPVHCDECQKEVEGMTFSGMCEACYAIQCPMCGDEKTDPTREFCQGCREDFGADVELAARTARLAGELPPTGWSASQLAAFVASAK